MSDLNIGCVNCKERIRRKRGVCPNCYTKFRRLIAKGETSWDELEKQGKALPILPIEEVKLRSIGGGYFGGYTPSLRNLRVIGRR